MNLSNLFLSRIGGGLSCVDSNSQLSEDDRICFSGIGNMSHDLAASSAGSRTHGRVTPSALLVLALQLAIRLVSVDHGPLVNVTDSVLAVPSLMDDLFDAVNCCMASTLASSLGVAVIGDSDFASAQLNTTVADYVLQLLLQLFSKTSNVMVSIVTSQKTLTRSSTHPFYVTEPFPAFD